MHWVDSGVKGKWIACANEHGGSQSPRRVAACVPLYIVVVRLWDNSPSRREDVKKNKEQMSRPQI